jgi:hypothetical protein
VSNIQWGALAVLVLIYAGSGLVELPMWRRSVTRFMGWGYPAEMALINPALKLAGGLLAAWPQTRSWGVLLCAVIGIAASATVLRARDKAMYGPALFGTALTLLCAFLILRPVSPG